MKLIRLYIAQHGQSATVVITPEDGEAVLRAIVGAVPFMLSSKEKSANGAVKRTSGITIVPRQGGVVHSLSDGLPIPMSAAGRPIPVVDGKPTAAPAYWDKVADSVVSTFERLPWGEG